MTECGALAPCSVRICIWNGAKIMTKAVSTGRIPPPLEVIKKTKILVRVIVLQTLMKRSVTAYRPRRLPLLRACGSTHRQLVSSSGYRRAWRGGRWILAMCWWNRYGPIKMVIFHVAPPAASCTPPSLPENHSGSWVFRHRLSCCQEKYLPSRRTRSHL